MRNQEFQKGVDGQKSLGTPGVEHDFQLLLQKMIDSVCLKNRVALQSETK